MPRQSLVCLQGYKATQTEVWDQDLYALSPTTTASAPHSHRKDKPADPPVYVDTQTDPKNSTDVHNMTTLGVE